MRKGNERNRKRNTGKERETKMKGHERKGKGTTITEMNEGIGRKGIGKGRKGAERKGKEGEERKGTARKGKG